MPAAASRRAWLVRAAATATLLAASRSNAEPVSSGEASRVSGGESLGGQTCLRSHTCDDGSLLERITQIDRAQHSIEIAYYIIDSGVASMAILESLRRAALRGVRVRLLYDGIKSKIPDGVLRILISSGVQIRIFNPTCLLRPARLNRRFHGKMLIRDGQELTTGSRNLEDSHFGRDSAKTFLDQDLCLRGPIAQQAKRSFDKLWRSESVETPKLDADKVCRLTFPRLRKSETSVWQQRVERTACCSGYQSLLDEALQRATVKPLGHCGCSGVCPGFMVTNDRLRWITDCQIDKSCRCFQNFVIRALGAAESCVIIESPYPVFSRGIRAALTAALRRGVRVELLTNSLRSTDQIDVYAAFQNQKRSLIRAGVQIVESAGDATVHAKMLLIDGCFSMVGSYNFDVRSDRLNLETAVAILDVEVHTHLIDAARGRFRAADRIPSDRRILEHPEGTDARKRLKLWLRRGIVPIYRSCL